MSEKYILSYMDKNGMNIYLSKNGMMRQHNNYDYWSDKDVKKTDDDGYPTHKTLIVEHHKLVRYTGNRAKVVIPHGIGSIGHYAFTECDNLTSIVLPDSLLGIGDYAFANCIKLDNVVLPSEVDRIGAYAFFNCFRLTSIKMPIDLWYINKGAFEYCDGLTSIELPHNLKRIGTEAFANCSKLTSIKINKYADPLGLGIGVKDKTIIEEYAFDNCPNLRSFISEIDIDFGKYAFSECSSLSTIQIGKTIYNVDKFSSDIYKSGIDLNGEYKVPLISYCENPETLSINYTEDLLHELIKYCIKNGLQKNQIYFTNLLYDKSNLTVDKSNTSVGVDKEDGETSLF